MNTSGTTPPGQAIGKAKKDPCALEAYASGLEHLLDEFRRLDLLIWSLLPGQAVLSQENALQNFKGLVLTEEEIRNLLGDPGEPDPSSNEQPPNPQLTLALEQADSRIRARRSASWHANVQLPLQTLGELFHLTDFEEQCLLICLAPAVDRKYEKIYAYLQDDVTRRKPSVDLVLNLLCPTLPKKIAARRAFDSLSPLFQHRLLTIHDDSPDGQSPLLSRSLTLDDRLVNFFLESERIDSRIRPFVRLAAPQSRLEEVALGHPLRNRLQAFISQNCLRSATNPIFVHFSGPAGSGKELLAQATCHELALNLLMVDVSRMAESPLPLEESLRLIAREAKLQAAAIGLKNCERLLLDEKALAHIELLIEVATTGGLVVFLLTGWLPEPLRWPNGGTLFTVEIPIPNDDARRGLWRSHLNGRSPRITESEASALASKFRLTSGQIKNAVATAENLARWRANGDGEVTAGDLLAACRTQSVAKLDGFARRIPPGHTWNDIVLPADSLAQLGELCGRVNQSGLVMTEWGFGAKLATGKGVTALFFGPSGTGKTMAAGIIAHELGLELYKIDLSQVVSKYIGETEKNLNSIFAAAESANVILFFDEADALFGRRSEVRDSHDRYANIETSYLLQKMEDYDGVAILATNLRQNLDEAFVRRLAFTIEFPFPDEAERLRIWSGIWPPEVSLAKDVDLQVLARRFKLSGGNVRNIALAAAFLAAANNGIVSMSHLLFATRREFQKLGRASTEFDGAEIVRHGKQSQSALDERSARGRRR